MIYFTIFSTFCVHFAKVLADRYVLFARAVAAPLLPSGPLVQVGVTKGNSWYKADKKNDNEPKLARCHLDYLHNPD